MSPLDEFLTATADMRRYLIDVSARRQETKFYSGAATSLPDHHASNATVTSQRQLAIAAIALLGIRGALWQGFRHCLAYLFDPQSEPELRPPTILSAGHSDRDKPSGRNPRRNTFGISHIGGRTLLDCCLKVVVYGLVCLLVRPHGLLTVVAGHLVNNMIGLAAFKVLQRVYKNDLPAQMRISDDQS